MNNQETQETLNTGHEDRHITNTSQKTKKTSNTNPVKNRGLSQKKVRENRISDQQWTIKRHGQHWTLDTKTDT